MNNHERRKVRTERVQQFGLAKTSVWSVDQPGKYYARKETIEGNKTDMAAMGLDLSMTSRRGILKDGQSILKDEQGILKGRVRLENQCCMRMVDARKHSPMDGECGETPPSFGQKICLSLKAKLESSPTSCWAQDALLYGGADPPNSAGRISLREKKRRDIS